MKRKLENKDQSTGDEASYISNLRKDREKQYNHSLANRRVRLRSSVFDLPEFAKSPIASVVILTSSQAEVQKAESFVTKYASNKDVEFALLIPDGLVLPDGIEIKQINLEKANHSTFLNEIAVKMTGKIICMLTSLENFDDMKLSEMINKIKDDNHSQICVHQSENKMEGIAMASDAFYLARGLDELIEDVEIALLDLALRLEMLGGQINGPDWPIANISSRAEKNIRKGRLIVNQGSASFNELG